MFQENFEKVIQMSSKIKQLDENTIRNICAVIADTNNGLSGSEIKTLLLFFKIPVIYSNENKRTNLYNNLISYINKTNDQVIIYKFLEKCLTPMNYTKENQREKFNWLYEELNKVLLFIGYKIRKDGKIILEEKSTTLDEVDKRVNSLKTKLRNRCIHEEIYKYCITDYLRKDYFDTVFEATKGLLERIRELSGLKTDGAQLIQEVFSTKSPYLAFNFLETESEESEHKGLKELLEAICHLVRNPPAHTPKINWKIDEEKALDVLTLISFAHKYLDCCFRIKKNI